jgi:hypothetical protein
MKTHWKKQFNYDYLGAYSLPGGQDMTLTIKETKKEMVTGSNGQKEECFVCYFSDSNKPMILNRTNCKTIENLYSPYVEDWVGKKITLYAEKVKAFGEVTDALRVRPKVPVTKKEALTPSHARWNEVLQKLKGGASLEKVEQYFELSEENKNLLMEAAI